MVSAEGIPQLGDIYHKVLSMAADQSVQELISRFQHDPALLAVPITLCERFHGIISRRELFNLMSRPFAGELYAKKPVSILLQEISRAQIVMEPDLDVNSAVARLLVIDPDLSIEAFPLVAHDCCIGIVSVSDLMMAVSETQQKLLGTLNLLNARIREEVDKASKIQQDLLPLPAFFFRGIALGAGLTTSSEIGGDFYDYFTIDCHLLGLVIADVSGHGVQAGMVTTAAKASLHTLLSLGVKKPTEFLSGMNSAIFATARQTLLMTCFIAVIDVQAATLTFANAGHNFPYLHHRGKNTLEMLDSAIGFPLGFEQGSVYPESVVEFKEGDSLYLYTDGLVECCNGQGEELGYSRLEGLLNESLNYPPENLHGLFLHSAAKYTGSHTFADDVTTLVASFQGFSHGPAMAQHQTFQGDSNG